MVQPEYNISIELAHFGDRSGKYKKHEISCSLIFLTFDQRIEFGIDPTQIETL